MDFTFEDSEIIEKNENLLIHLFFNLLNYDFRSGFFSNESSIYDMSGTGFNDEDYIALSEDYYKECPDNYSYSEGMKLYQKLNNQRFDKMIANKFENTYGFILDEKVHFLKDFIILLNKSFPKRNWDTDIIFIVKTLDNRLDKEEKLISKDLDNKDKKIIKLPVRKKLSPEEVKNCSNEYLMVKELGMNWEDARKLAKINFDKKMIGKKFEPYLPEKKSLKPKM